MSESESLTHHAQRSTNGHSDAEEQIEAIVERFLEQLQAGENPDRAALETAHPELAPALGRRLAVVEMMFGFADATQTYTDSEQSTSTGGAARAIQLKCPYCGNRIPLEQPEVREVICANCGSSLQVEAQATTDYRPEARPKTIGKFTILELLGRGAFGTVYRARDPELDRFVAIKVPRAGSFSAREDVERFLREARHAARLKHSGIVSVYEIGHSHDSPYIVSEYIAGLTLADLLTGTRPSFRDTAEIMARIAEALAYAHESGVIHRDLKPANILLQKDEVGRMKDEPKRDHANSSFIPHPSSFILPKITDFGLARRDEGEITVTQDGQILGTPAYMSPEQAAGESLNVDARTDIYSLGVVLYELLTGELPFRGNKRMLLHQVLHDEPRPPRRINDGIPRDLETICLKAIAKERGRRYQSAQEMAGDLHRYLNGEPIKARPVSKLERAWLWAHRRPGVAALLATLALVLTTGIPSLFLLWRQADAAKGEIEKKREAVERAKDESDKERDAARRHLYGAQATLMQIAWRERDIDRVRQLLELQTPKESEPDLRGFEWHYFARLVEGSRVTLTGHMDTVTAVVFSPDRRHLASGSKDGTAKIWELATRLELASFPGHEGGVAGLALSPNGRRLAVVGRDGTVRVWHVATGKEAFSLPKRYPGTGSLAFSPDGGRLAVVGKAKTTLHDETGVEIQAFAGNGKQATAVTFSADGQSLAAAGADGIVRIWETASGKEQQQFGTKRTISRIAFMADGRHMLIAAHAGILAIARLDSGSIVTEFGAGPAFDMSRDGRQFAHLGEVGTMRVVDPTTGREIFALRKHDGPVTCVAFSPDGARVATGSEDRTVKVWLAGHFELDVQQIPGHIGEVFAVRFSPDGMNLASGGADGKLRVYKATTGQLVHLLHAHPPVLQTAHAGDQLHRLIGTSTLAYRRDGAWIASGGADGAVRIWEASTGKLLRTIRAHTNAVTGISFSPDGKQLASSSWDKTAKIWDADSGKLLHTLSEHTREVTRVAFSPDGKLVASCSWDQTIRLWNSATGAAIRSLNWQSRQGHIDPIDSIAFHPNGKHIAAAPDQLGPGGEVRVFDIETGAAVHSLSGHIYGIFQVIFSDDGRRLASCSCDGELKVWDMATGQQLFSYHNQTGLRPGEIGAIDTRRDALHSVALSPDGKRLALGCRNSKVLIFDATGVSRESLVQREACRVVESLFTQFVTKTAVLEHLGGADILSQPVRDEARARAERYCPDPLRLNQLSWLVVRMPEKPKADYRRALLQAQEACRLMPGVGEFLNTLGVAQYRAGQFESAVTTLKQSDMFQSARFKRSHPSDLAFLAMACHRLGRKEEASSTLQKLRELMKKNSRFGQDDEARAFLKEAEALVEEKLHE